MRRTLTATLLILLVAGGVYLGRGLLLDWLARQLSTVSDQQGPYLPVGEPVRTAHAEREDPRGSAPPSPADANRMMTSDVAAEPEGLDEPGAEPVAALFGVGKPREVLLRVLGEGDLPLEGVRVREDISPYDVVGTTDANGETRIPVRAKDHAQNPVVFYLEAEGWSPARVLVPPMVDEKEVRLRRGAHVTGRVEDEMARAVAGATVRARPGGGRRENPWGGRETVSDAGGRFFLDSLPLGGVSLEVDAAGYVPFSRWVPEKELGDEIVLRLETGVELEVLVRGADGEPVPGALVEGHAVLSRGGTSRVEEAMTDGKGLALLLGFPKGRREIRLDVRAEGYRPVDRRIRGEEASRAYVEVDLADPTATVRGRVRTEAGEPLPGFARFRYLLGRGDRQEQASFDASGRFEWKGAPLRTELRLEVWWHPPGGIRASGPFLVHPMEPLEEGETREIDLVVPGLVEVIARVETEDGEPAVGVKIGARSLDPPPDGKGPHHSYGQTGVDGNAEMLVPAGTYKFWAQRGRWTAAELEMDISGKRAKVLLRIEEGLTIAGVVIDGRGEPVPDRRLRLRSGPYSRDTTTDGVGEFYFGKLPDRTFDLHVEGSSGEWNGLSLTGLAGGDESLTIQLLAGSIAGRVVEDGSGRGMAAQVQYGKTGSGRRSNRTTRSGDDGYFLLDDISVGEWWFSVTARGYLPRSQKVFIDGPTDAVFALQPEARLRVDSFPPGASSANIQLLDPKSKKQRHRFQWKGGEKAVYGGIHPGRFRVVVESGGMSRSLELDFSSGRTSVFLWEKAK